MMKVDFNPKALPFWRDAVDLKLDTRADIHFHMIVMLAKIIEQFSAARRCSYEGVFDALGENDLFVVLSSMEAVGRFP